MLFVSFWNVDVESCPWKSEVIESEVEFIQKVTRIIRSARSDYNLPNKTKTEAFIVSSDEQSTAVLKKYAKDLSTTAYCSALHFDQTPPSGCAILTISGQCEVHLLMKGMIQVDKELQKMEKQQTQLVQTLEKLNQLMLSADYETKVPVDVQNANQEKRATTEAEITRLTAAMESLKLLA